MFLLLLFNRSVKSKLLNHIVSKLNINDLKLGELDLFYKLNTRDKFILHDTYIHELLFKNRAYESSKLNLIVIVFLNDHHYETTFEGGRLLFNMNSDLTSNSGPNQPGKLGIDPKKGRVVYFTSGNENAFELEQVTSGFSYAYITTIECA